MRERGREGGREEGESKFHFSTQPNIYIIHTSLQSTLNTYGLCRHVTSWTYCMCT